MVKYIDDRRGEYGVESICRVIREELRLSTTSRRHARAIRPADLPEFSGMLFSARRSARSGRTTSRSMEHGRCGGNCYGTDSGLLDVR
jgi:hypothetical protein